MVKKRVKKRRSVTPKRHDTDHDSPKVQCPFCDREMRVRKRRIRAGMLIVLFKCICGTTIEAGLEPYEKPGSFSD